MRSADWGRRLSAAAVAALLIYLVVVPLVLLAISSLRPTGFPMEPGWTFSNFAKVYGDETFAQLIGTTVVFALSATLLALVFGILLAWLFAREAHGWATWIGGATVLAALVYNETGRTRVPRASRLHQAPG